MIRLSPSDLALAGRLAALEARKPAPVSLPPAPKVLQ